MLPPQHYIESSCDDFKDCVKVYQLHSYFGGYQLKNYGLLSKLGTLLSVVDNNQKISNVDELVNVNIKNENKR